MPGVLGVWTAADLAASNYGPYANRMAGEGPRRFGGQADQQARAGRGPGPLCRRSDRLRGGRNLAGQDAAEAVIADIDPLPAVTTPPMPPNPARPNCGTTFPATWCSTSITAMPPKPTRPSQRPRMSRGSISTTRASPWSPLEPRAGMAIRRQTGPLHAVCADTGRCHQQGAAGPAAQCRQVQVRIVTGHVGGSFGMKSVNYPEYVCLLHASKVLGTSGEMDR